MVKLSKQKNIETKAKDAKVSTIGLLKASLKFMAVNEKKSLIWGLILSFLEAFLYTFGTAMTGFIISWFFTEGVMKHTAAFKTDLFIVAMVSLAICFILYLVTRLLQNRMLLSTAFKTTAKMRSVASNKLIYMPISYHDKNKIGDQISTLTNDINNIAQTLVQLFNDTSGKIFKIIFSIIFMLCYSITLSSIVLPISFLFSGLSWVFLAKARKPFIEVINHFGDMNAYVEEMIKNTKVTQSFDKQEKAIEDFEKIARKIRKSAFKGDVYTKFFDPWFVVFSNFLVLMILSVSLIFKNKNIPFVGLIGQDVTAIIIGYINLLWTFTGTLQIFFSFIFSTQVGVASTTRIFKLVGLEPPAPIRDPQYLYAIDMKGHVEFDNVSFRYDENSSKYQLRNASFYAKPGQIVAIVGPTGAGKTTIINLLSKFYEYEAGSIKIDGIELNKIPKDNLLELMTVVLQDSFMFNDTIMNNLKVGNPRVSDQEVIQAATLTNAHQFIQSYKHGYDTIVENNGANLSQGERQLLSITRAILGNKKILVLDEATSNVDSNTEKIIQDALQNSIMKNKTSFVIAHRLSTVRNADLILVVDDGKIIEKGKHEELMQLKGFYYNLHQSQ
ncbi:ABC transporter ATP-binding protein [Mycoplasmopsis primatum]|uniref:ABC transporter ATP-binding protein n=1 Tax=Mycoplasmopsis primatum TaxID=55604 RepID=UPI000497E325|nr:ABC transporter ATP-binding protein [Mycoplasmopsis primatum]